MAVSGGRTYMLMKSPFFGTLAMLIRVVEQPACKTMAVDGVSLFYNPEFVLSLSANHLRSGIVHELFHIILKHHLRRGSRNHLVWNFACDYAVNLMLVKAGFELGPGWLLDHQYEGMTAEQIYHKLTSSMTPEQKQKMEDGQFGDVQDLPAGGGKGDQEGKGAGGRQLTASPAEMSAAEMDLNSKIRMAATAAKKAGNLPAGLEAMIDQMTESKTDWQSRLSRFVDSHAKNDYSYRKLSRSAMQRGFVAPTLDSEELGECVIIMDLSGSIGRKEQCKQLGEVFAILDRYDVQLTLASADTDIYMVGQWEKGDMPDPDSLVFTGGGGTSLHGLNDWLAEKNIRPRFAIYLTDGYLSQWGDEPAFPLLVGLLPDATKQYVPEWAEIVEII